MSRSCWKVPFIHPLFFSKKFLKSSVFSTYIRTSLIGPLFIDKKLKIYNGLRFVSIFLNKNMVGDKIGEYSISKIMGSKIVYSMRRKKKANRMRK